VLARAGAHDARFVTVDRETLFDGDRRDLYMESHERLLEFARAGKCQIVGVATIGGAE